MHGVAYAAALVLAAAFGWAALAKLTARADTARTFQAFGLHPKAATVVPVVELVLAVALVVVPGWAAAVGLALLAAFSTFLVRAIRSGVTAPCACFGNARQEPLSWVELVRNGLLTLTGVVALAADGPTVPDVGAAAAVAATTVAGRGVLRWADRRRRDALEGPILGSLAPEVPGAEWSSTTSTLVAFFSPRCPRCAQERTELGAEAVVVDLDPESRPLFDAYRVRATPYYVVVDAAGLVRWRGAELSAAHKAK